MLILSSFHAGDEISVLWRTISDPDCRFSNELSLNLFCLFLAFISGFLVTLSGQRNVSFFLIFDSAVSQDLSVHILICHVLHQSFVVDHFFRELSFNLFPRWARLNVVLLVCVYIPFVLILIHFE